jgi:hypothetical protein
VGDRSDRVSIHHNLMAHNDFRNPLIMSGGTHDVVNNVVYNWGALVTEILDDAPKSVNIVGNYYRAGRSSKSPFEIMINPSGADAIPKMFVAGNVKFEQPDPSSAWQRVQFGWRSKGASEKYRATTPFSTAPITTSTAEEARELVLAGAGATLPRRDRVDIRVVDEVRRGTGAIIDSPAQVGGYPPYAGGPAPPDADGDGMSDEWERRMGLDAANPADGSRDADGDGYSNVEEYLHSLTSDATRQPSPR